MLKSSRGMGHQIFGSVLIALNFGDGTVAATATGLLTRPVSSRGANEGGSQ